MKKEIETFETDCLDLGVPLILLLGEGGYLIGAMTEQGGSYPLLDFELDKIYLHHAIEQEDRDYNHVYNH